MAGSAVFIRRIAVSRKESLINEAPAPAVAGFKRFDNRVSGFAKVRACMSVP
jgi:hypothetical protein